MTRAARQARPRPLRHPRRGCAGAFRTPARTRASQERVGACGTRVRGHACRAARVTYSSIRVSVSATVRSWVLGVYTSRIITSQRPSDASLVNGRGLLRREFWQLRGSLACGVLLVWLSAMSRPALAQTKLSDTEGSSELSSSLTYVEAQLDKERALKLKQRNLTIAGSVLLSVGVARGVAVGVVSLAMGVTGIALLARRRAVKKERQRLQVLAGPSFLRVRGRF